MSSLYEELDYAEEIDGEGCHDDIRKLVDVYEKSDDPDEIRRALSSALSTLIGNLT